MFSSTIKRSVATLGVVAGLLAAAGPASAMPAGVSPSASNDALKAGASEVLYETVTVKAPTKAKAKPAAKSGKANLGKFGPRAPLSISIGSRLGTELLE